MLNALLVAPELPPLLLLLLLPPPLPLLVPLWLPLEVDKAEWLCGREGMIGGRDRVSVSDVRGMIDEILRKYCGRNDRFKTFLGYQIEDEERKRTTKQGSLAEYFRSE